MSQNQASQRSEHEVQEEEEEEESRFSAPLLVDKLQVRNPGSPMQILSKNQITEQIINEFPSAGSWFLGSGLQEAC